MKMKLNAATESYTYAYDALNRLTTASLSGAGRPTTAPLTATTNWATS